MEEKYWKNKEVKIYYEVEKRDLMFVYLHGSGCNHTIFNSYREYFKELGAGFLSIDQRGNGKSTHFISEKEYVLKNYVSDLEKIIKKEEIEKAILVGHSLGTMVAQGYAIKHPEKVLALALISPSYNFKKTLERDLARKAFLDMDWLTKQLFIRYNQVRTLGNFHRKQYYPDYSQKKFIEMNDWEFLKETYRENTYQNVRAIQAVGQALMKWDLEKEIPQIKCPTLIIHGTYDQLVPIKTAYELYEMIPKAEKPIIISNSTHSLVFRYPKLMIKNIEEFLIEKGILKNKS